MKIKLAVLFGGKSVEHEVSVISALQAIENLDRGKYQIVPVFISKLGRMHTGQSLLDVENYRDLEKLLADCRECVFVPGSHELELFPYKGIFKKSERVKIDVALPITHGTNVEDGALQGMLRGTHIPFVGCDVLASAVCMDKFFMKTMLRAGGFPVLDGIRLNRNDYLCQDGCVQKIISHFDGTVIVKPINLGSSVGISKAEGELEIMEALRLAFSFSDQVIVEKAVSPLREINCAVLGDELSARASVCEEPIAADKILSYADKYLSGGTKPSGACNSTDSKVFESRAKIPGCYAKGSLSGKYGGTSYGAKGTSKGMAGLKRIIPAQIPNELCEKIKQTAVEAFKFLGCHGVARADFLLNADTNEFYLNEFNTIPGSLSFYLWEPAGLKYGALLDELIDLAVKRSQRQDDLVYTYDENILSFGNHLQK